MELWLQCPWLSTLYWEKRYFLRFLPAFYLLHQSFSLPFPTMTITRPLALKLFHSWYFFADSWCVTSKGSARLRTFLLPWVSGTQLKKQTNKKQPHKTQKPKPHPPPPHTKSKSFPSAAFDPEADLCLQVNNCFLLVSYILYLGLVWYEKCNQGIFRYPRPEKKDKTSQSLIFNPK